jgi:hypothetical protein
MHGRQIFFCTAQPFFIIRIVGAFHVCRGISSNGANPMAVPLQD